MDGREQSVNKDNFLPDQGIRETEVDSRQPLLQLKAARDVVDSHDDQDVNDGILDTNRSRDVQQEESQKVVVDCGGPKDIKPLDDKGIVYSKLSLQAIGKDHDVDMELEQTNTADNFVFAASKLSSNGEGGKLGRKWKRVARSGSVTGSGGQTSVAKKSGKKREGLDGTMMGGRKKSKEAGEMGFDDISDFNSPHMAEVPTMGPELT
ncbi:hypothetical protein COLO4_36571 [Corchorus olitorius]|uniref:Uncharacterized protein n=1 Tax=Corchorus olitorius TaxID=93759 RepID=A0A1R3G7U9_9ROSI|nr:hypothetical protein COLO4_36571 [Corchorus olitorius]